jgi:tripartite-type tricarboxylate transporter receptor subunit TctC
MTLPRYVFPPAALAALDKPKAKAGASMPFPAAGIQIIVPTSAGGGNDTMARALARKLGPLLGQTIAVDNRGGGNGSIASEYVAAAQPDGYTLLFGYIATHGINPVLQATRYDPIADFAPVGTVGRSATLLVVNAEMPVYSVRGLVELLKSQPGRFSYASAGEGTIPHIAAELFKMQTGASMFGMVYPGAAPAITDVARGSPQIMFPSLFTAKPYLQSGKLRALAVAGFRRLPDLSELPTLAEAGIPCVDLTQWYALFAPAKTPESVTTQLNHALNTVLQDREIVVRFAAEGMQVGAGSSMDLHDLLQVERAKWQQVVQQLNLQMDVPAVD